MTKPNLTNPIHLLAFGLGSGLAPKAPGTFGTLAAVPLYFLIAPLPLPLYVAWLVAAFILGVAICDRTSRDLGVHDHSGIVWDEFVGLWVTLILVPPGWWWVVVGFLLFRLFDIWKPWPIGWADRRVGGGLGIMLDDLLAGFYAWGLLQLAARGLG
ncbi:phosphatidylglycerophosphatase A family protein [Endothiovibrio diazotrophicus]